MIHHVEGGTGLCLRCEGKNAKGDERKYAAIISNDAYPEDIRKLAAERMYKEQQLKQDGAKVEKILKIKNE